MAPKTSRRAFLGTIGGLAVGVLAACQPAPTPIATPTASKPAASSKPTATSNPAVSSKPAPAPTQQTGQRSASVLPSTSAPNPSAAAGPPKRGGEVRIVQIDDVVTMDPIHASGPTPKGVYDSLFAWRPNAQGVYGIEPMLAKSWDLGHDKLVIELQENVKFHDGSDLNADAVVWNIARMVQNPGSFASGYLPEVDRDKPGQALGPRTVQVNLARPSATILNALSDGLHHQQTAIVSKAAAEKHGEAWLKLNPVGSGPFSFVSFVAGDKLVVERNPTYWRMGADGRSLPYADRLTVRVIVEASQQVAAMREGAADWIANVPGRDVAAAKAIPHATYIESALTGVKRQFFFNAARPPFKDNLKLRQAIHHAIDRRAMAQALGAGLGIPLPYELAPGSIGYDTSVPTYRYNPDTSKRLLAESGVTLPLEVRLTAHSREVDQQQARLILAMLDKVGIKINLDIVDRVAWGEKVRNNDFEMATHQSGIAMDPSQDLALTWAEGGSSAYHRARVPGLLDTLQKADAEHDEKKRHQAFVDAQRLMHESAWFGYLWFENGNFLVHKRIQGFPAGWGPMREAEWWINE